MTTTVTITHGGPDRANVLIETVDNVRPPQKHTVLAATESLELPVYKDMRLLVTETQDDSTSGKQTSEVALAAKIAAEKAQAAADLAALASEQVADLSTGSVASLSTAAVSSLSTASVAALSSGQVPSTK
jgi:hypothetical protein